MLPNFSTIHDFAAFTGLLKSHILKLKVQKYVYVLKKVKNLPKIVIIFDYCVK